MLQQGLDDMEQGQTNGEVLVGVSCQLSCSFDFMLQS